MCDVEEEWERSGQGLRHGCSVIVIGTLQGSAYGDKPRSDVCSPVIYVWTSVGDSRHTSAHGIPRNILESGSVL